MRFVALLLLVGCGGSPVEGDPCELMDRGIVVKNADPSKPDTRLGCSCVKEVCTWECYGAPGACDPSHG